MVSRGWGLGGVFVSWFFWLLSFFGGGVGSKLFYFLTLVFFFTNSCNSCSIKFTKILRKLSSVDGTAFPKGRAGGKRCQTWMLVNGQVILSSPYLNLGI